ncbi:MAG: hypothetical protein AAFY34_14870 [Pseudomonadota bacterium]
MPETVLNLLIGGGLGIATLIPFYKARARTLAELGFLAFAIMVAIYVGAHLVTSGFERLAIEFVAGNIAVGFAFIIKSKFPAGIGVLIIAHGIYDYTIGHSSGVADWYPDVCAGFDLVVGATLTFLIHRRADNSLRNSKWSDLY